MLIFKNVMGLISRAVNTSKTSDGQCSWPQDKTQVYFIDGHIEIPPESIIYKYPYTTINLWHAFQRSDQFCVNNLTWLWHLSAQLDCNYSWPLPPATVHLIRSLLIFCGLWEKVIAHIISHSWATFLCETNGRIGLAHADSTTLRSVPVSPAERVTGSAIWLIWSVFTLI